MQNAIHIMSIIGGLGLLPGLALAHPVNPLAGSEHAGLQALLVHLTTSPDHLTMLLIPLLLVAVLLSARWGLRRR